MEKLICHYLRILDIDPFGYFIRLINTSYNQSLNLSNIHIRQFSVNNQTLNSYTFNKQIGSLLYSGEVVTIFSKHYGLLKFDIEPHIFIAQDISQWLIDIHIRTEISINKTIFHSYKICSITTNDVPLLFIHRSIDSKSFPTKIISQSNQYTRFIFPYCLSIDNIVNPHTSAKSDRNENNLKRDICHENNQIVKHFDSYSRRLTTSPKIIQSSKKT
ncbi:unnamed protein product [Rotaria sp. Silwood2]|nr:unnamed protein product [Rotaria sp. Silwood2]CAF2583419.1 unnamed protein product [Rotaria sp. Silwood2]CAF2991197.1 unnamed protein product [Rotaria sp. Silwood2]CAF3867383.1 unnamed protein product [Rotaria sp. Silwood2]CAF3981892.1 unnamed protein product [Rotaria sp. Silwood2]